MRKQSPNLFAAMHVGSEQVSMQIVEYNGLNELKIIDRASCQVALGEETFKTGKIGFGVVSEICELLKGYRRKINEYGVRDYRLLATTAIREAENQQYIIDQIKIKTGFRAEVVDMPQEIFYKYVALFKMVNESGLIDHESNLFVDISSGGLGITLYSEGGILYQQNIHIGALRIKESFEKYQRESMHFHRALSEYIYSTIEPVEKELASRKIKNLILSGVETRLLLKMLGRNENEDLVVISREEFDRLYEQVKILNLPQLMKTFNLLEHRAEMVLPTIVLYKQILSLTAVEDIVIPSGHFSDGIVLLYVAEKTADPWLNAIEDQIISLALALARKYQYDPKHASAVENISLLIFDRLVKVHGLGKRERLLLKVAAILHDIGKFVSLRRHYFYSYRLIISSDILGFSDEERALMANVAYYHSKGTPSIIDPNFAALTKEQRVTVAKLSAIIRLADAVDRSHRQKARECEISLKGDEMTISVVPHEEMSLEDWTFLDKADFFENVFGIRAILQRQIR